MPIFSAFLVGSLCFPLTGFCRDGSDVSDQCVSEDLQQHGGLRASGAPGLELLRLCGPSGPGAAPMGAGGEAGGERLAARGVLMGKNPVQDEISEVSS